MDAVIANGPEDPVRRRTVVFLGIGHTNALLLRRWAEQPIKDCRIVGVTNFPQSTYSGMLPGVMSQQLDRAEMQIDLTSLARRAGAELLQQAVVRLDAETRTLYFENAKPLRFDILSVGVGSVPAAIDTTDSSALLPVKPMQTFLERLDERIRLVASQKSHADSIRCSVIGGGVAGIEIALCLRTRMQRLFPSFNVSIEIISSSDEVAKELRLSSIRKLRKVLSRRQIQLRLSTRVIHVDGDCLLTDDHQRINTDCAILATAAKGPPLLSGLGLPVDSSGFLATHSTLLSTSNQPVFAVGDCGTVIEAPFPKAGVYAVREAPVLWENVRRMLRGQPLLSFAAQKDFLKLLNTGDGRALLQYNRLSFHGRWCWWLKKWIDRRFMRSLHS